MSRLAAVMTTQPLAENPARSIEGIQHRAQHVATNDALQFQAPNCTQSSQSRSGDRGTSTSEVPFTSDNGPDASPCHGCRQSGLISNPDTSADAAAVLGGSSTSENEAVEPMRTPESIILDEDPPNAGSASPRIFSMLQTLRSPSTLALLLTMVFGTGAWLGMNYANKYTRGSYQVALYELCLSDVRFQAITDWAYSNWTNFNA